MSGPDGSAPLTALLTDWLPRQRWFAGKGTGRPHLELVGSVRLAASGPAHCVVHLVRADDVLYQVPLTHHPAPPPDGGVPRAALVGTVHEDLGEGPGEHWVHDAPHDPQFVAALLRLIAGGEQAGDGPGDDGRGDDATRVIASGRRQAGRGPIDVDAAATVLSGEQSNTSMIVGADSPTPLIVKLFRVLAPGDNPDVVVQSALAAAGCRRVPAPAGWVEGEWPDPQGPRGRSRGHLAFAGEFLAGSEDAWRVATRAVAQGRSFDGPARDLGVATAEVHAVLAEVLPTVAVTPQVLDGLAEVLLDRLDTAIEAVPDLAPHADAARAVFEGVRRLPRTDDLQRVHGDYHLGQVLHSPGRGWVLLDFEGEPLRPLAQRLEPDLALRDVAGMLRSFDYAAAFATVGRGEDDPARQAARDWAGTAREAFLDGYATQRGVDLTGDPGRRELLRALELDKALYEAVYETRNRPDWLTIPMESVRRLLAG